MDILALNIYTIPTDPTQSYMENRNGIPDIRSVTVADRGDNCVVIWSTTAKRGKETGCLTITADAMDALCKKWMEGRA